MEYRKLPHGGEHERFSVLGIGLGGIGQTPPEEIEAIARKAIDHGVNFFDMCTAGATYGPLGRAIAGRREQVFLQCHFGAVYDENGEYGWCRDFETIKRPSSGSWGSWVPTMWTSASSTVWMRTRILTCW